MIELVVVVEITAVHLQPKCRDQARLGHQHCLRSQRTRGRGKVGGSRRDFVRNAWMLGRITIDQRSRWSSVGLSVKQSMIRAARCNTSIWCSQWCTTIGNRLMPPMSARLIDGSQETRRSKHIFSFDRHFALAEIHLHDRTALFYRQIFAFASLVMVGQHAVA